MKEIILNHKMNFVKEEILSYIEKLNNLETSHNVVVCPSFIYLPYFSSCKFKLGSQDVSAYKGKLTGDISSEQLRSLGVEYTIVGHSERREKYSETNELINKKIKRLKEECIIPILCVGEGENENYKEVILKQLENVILENVIIAYEPLVSIGTGVALKKEKIEEIIIFIKNNVLSNTKVIYGGSVDINNYKELLESKIIDGLLIGGASLDVNKLCQIIN